jgi:THAP4-like, heme-binding beta-barrel domain
VPDFPLHPDAAVLAPLVGTWVGEGEGDYPTIDDFGYTEEITFTHVGKPFLMYRQSTLLARTGLPAHGETGFLRAVAGGEGELELVMVHPGGIAEIASGSAEARPDGVAVHLASTSVVCTPTAKQVTSVERTITVAGDTLRYELAMGAVGQAHQHHLTAELRRTA